jgi:diguanylate cyclase (GGDEF)-like protein/PAS domain S-box-containing protein
MAVLPPIPQETLDTSAEEVFDRLTRIAARISEAPVALFTLVNGERHVCKSAVGLPPEWVCGPDTPLSYSFCRHTVERADTLSISDARRHPLVRRDPATMRGVVAYLGIPLATPARQVLGTLCVLDFEPREWRRQERELLAELAAAIVGKIELRAAVREAQEKALLAERASEALQESEERFRTAFQAAPIGMGLLGTDGRWLRVNPALCDLVGRAADELLQLPLTSLTHAHEVTGAGELERLLERRAARFEMEMRLAHSEGAEVWAFLTGSAVPGPGGEPAHYVVQMQDLTLRKREEERLRTLSLVDELTGLYNRRAFLAMAAEQCKLARRQERGLLLLFADVDRMKWINDTFGHLEGDRAIREVAQVLRQTFRESDLVARLGGDEFAVLATQVADNDPQALMERLLRKMEEVNSNRVTSLYPLAISVGAAAYDPSSGQGIEELIASADARMYLEKATKPSS